MAIPVVWTSPARTAWGRRRTKNRILQGVARRRTSTAWKAKKCLLIVCAGGSGFGVTQCFRRLEETLSHMKVTAVDRLPVTRFNRNYMLPALTKADEFLAEDAGRRMRAMTTDGQPVSEEKLFADILILNCCLPERRDDNDIVAIGANTLLLTFLALWQMLLLRLE